MNKELTTSDLILLLDKQQNGPGAVVCAQDANHGRLTAKNPTALICGACGYLQATNMVVKGGRA